MGAAYFIALDNPNPGFDPFVSGKAIAREGTRLSQIASSLGLRTLDEYVSMGSAEVASIAEEFETSEDVQVPPEQWFDADEGLAWVTRLRARIQSDLTAVKDPEGMLADLAQYERVLSQAHAVGAKWHFSLPAHLTPHPTGIRFPISKREAGRMRNCHPMTAALIACLAVMRLADGASAAIVFTPGNYYSTSYFTNNIVQYDPSGNVVGSMTVPIANVTKRGSLLIS